MSIIVIDLETTSLDIQTARVVEVAAMDMYDVDKSMYFVPNQESFSPTIDGEGLAINRYFERAVFRAMLHPHATRERYEELWHMLEGNTVAGSNPRFDTNLLSRVFRVMSLPPEPWHHRLLDLSAYAAGVLGLPMTELPGLSKVCKLVDVGLQAHSAMGDVQATRECFRRLERIKTAFE